jgi:hypothetical protein
MLERYKFMSVDYHRSKSLLGHTKPFAIDSLDIVQWTVKLLDVFGGEYTGCQWNLISTLFPHYIGN